MNEPAAGPRAGLGRTALFGAASQILSRGGRALVGVATVAILSRYMGPAEFGIAAMILFIMLFAQLFTDFGLRVALVQRETISEIELCSVFWFSVGIGLLISILIYLGSDLIALGFQEPRLGRYVEMISGVFVIAAARGIPMVLLERSFRFPAIASSEIGGAVTGGVAAVLAAWAGYTVEALVLQQIVMTVVPTVMNFVSARWLPRLQFSFAAIRPMLGFGASVTATAMIGFLAGNIDRPILATRLSAKDLGLFAIAGQIVATPIRTVAMNARRVTFPILASIQNDNVRVAAAHRDSLHAMFILLAPVCFGLAALSNPFVDVLLGRGWELAGPLVGISAVSALLWSVSELNSAIFTVKGAVNFMLRWSIFALAGTIAIFLLAAPYGLLAIAWARLVWNIVSVALHCWFLARRLDCSVGTLVMPLGRPVLAASIMAVIVYGVDMQLVQHGLSSLLRLVIGVPLGVVSYAGLILLVDRERVKSMVDRIRVRRSDAPPP
jgi:PST family polysaccharide transporter